MKKLGIQFWVLLASISLFFYGILHHISSSEFWPMTISKTWLNFSEFEFSLLQKPLFSIFLAAFHLLPLKDSEHILAVKIVFAALGMVSIYLWGTVGQERRSGLNGFAIALLLVTFSPLLRDNFFRIRSDQMTFFFFSIALWLKQSKRIEWAFIALGLMLTVSIKSVVFLIPTAFVFYPEFIFFWKKISRKRKFFLTLSFLAISIWTLAFNIGSLRYFIETFDSSSGYSFEYIRYVKTEWPLLFLSMTCSILLLRHAYFSKNNIFSVLGVLLTIGLWPQPLPFFVASLLWITYFPILVFAFIPQIQSRKKLFILATGILIQGANSLGLMWNELENNYTSNKDQISFIEEASNVIHKQNMTYLDGVGIFPRQKMVPCFVSPNDEASNNFCWNEISTGQPDAIIVTQRLAYFGVPLFKSLELNYEQLKPNFWIRKNLINQINPYEKQLIPKSGLPILIFGSE